MTAQERADLATAPVAFEDELPPGEERVARDRAVWLDWLDGLQMPAIAAREKLSVPTVERIVAAYRSAGARVRPGIAEQLLMAHDLVEKHARLIERFELLACDPSAQKQPQVVLAALKAKSDALERWKNLVQELGWLPKNLGTLKFQMDAVSMADALIDVMDERGVPEDVQREMIEAIEMRVSRREDGRLTVDLGAEQYAELPPGEPAAA
ncbi:MAG TPA: hypothetical protein VK631_09945 [Solirubrobacteraceae bacterium]|nr:hypothetical protein [Solirubrobacteraceae bacterium]